MSLKVVVDEDLPRQAVRLLRECGYDAASVIDLNWGGWKDPPLWIAIQKEERFLAHQIKGLATFAFIHLESILAFCFYVPMRMGFVL